jgi:hypothetical protein
MTDHDPTAAIAAQLAEQRERLAAADAREQAHHRALTSRLNELSRLVEEAVKDEAPILATVKRLEEAVATLAAKLAEVVPEDGPARVYKPSPHRRSGGSMPRPNSSSPGNCRPGSTTCTGRCTGTWRPGCPPAGRSTTWPS